MRLQQLSAFDVAKCIHSCLPIILQLKREFIFHFIFAFVRRIALQHRWFSRCPPVKGKICKLKIQSYTIDKKNRTETVEQNLKRKIDGVVRAWLLASL